MNYKIINTETGEELKNASVIYYSVDVNQIHDVENATDLASNAFWAARQYESEMMNKYLRMEIDKVPIQEIEQLYRYANNLWKKAHDMETELTCRMWDACLHGIPSQMAVNASNHVRSILENITVKHKTC